MTEPAKRKGWTITLPGGLAYDVVVENTYESDVFIQQLITALGGEAYSWEVKEPTARRPLPERDQPRRERMMSFADYEADVNRSIPRRRREMSAKTDLINDAENAMEINAQHVHVDPPADGESKYRHRHVAIAWEGGVVWLDMSVQHDHYCIDVRQFVPGHVAERLEYLRSQIRAECISYGEIAELQGLAEHIGPGDVELLEWAGVPEHDDRTSRTDPPAVELAGQGVFTIVNGRRQSLGMSAPGMGEPEALADPDGTPVKGHGWNGGYVVTLMHDKVPSERQTNRPAGPGRG